LAAYARRHGVWRRSVLNASAKLARISRAEANYRKAWERDPQRLIEQAVHNQRIDVGSYASVSTVEQERERGALLAQLPELAG
jgi:hypothetical protein